MKKGIISVFLIIILFFLVGCESKYGSYVGTYELYAVESNEEINFIEYWHIKINRRGHFVVYIKTVFDRNVEKSGYYCIIEDDNIYLYYDHDFTEPVESDLNYWFVDGEIHHETILNVGDGSDDNIYMYVMFKKR